MIIEGEVKRRSRAEYGRWSGAPEPPVQYHFRVGAFGKSPDIPDFEVLQREALPVQDKFYRNGSRNTRPTYPRCGLSDVTVHHAHEQCPTRLPIGCCHIKGGFVCQPSIVKIVPPISFNRESKAVSTVKEYVSQTRAKVLATSTFLPGKSLINLLKYYL